MKKIWIYFQWMLGLIFAFLFIFIGNSYRYFIYALLLSAISYFLFGRMVKRRLAKHETGFKVRYDSNGKRISAKERKRTIFLIVSFSIYLGVLSVFSLSPYAERSEFALTHPGWQSIKPEITDVTAEINGGRSNRYTYVDVTYEFAVGGKVYTGKEKKAEKLYYFFRISEGRFEKMKGQSLERAMRHISNNDYILFYNTDNPQQSRFFLSGDRFYLQGSVVYDLLCVYSVLVLILLAVFIGFRKGHKEENNTIKITRFRKYF